MLPVIPCFEPFGNKVRKEKKKKKEGEACRGLRLLIVVTRGGILMTGLRLAK